MLQPDVWYLSGGGLESMHLMIEDVKKGLEENCFRKEELKPLFFFLMKNKKVLN